KRGRRSKFYSDDYSESRKENYNLRQQLAEVKQQLAAILEELQKLKNNLTPKVQEQVNKSQVLMNKINTAVLQPDNKGNSLLLYIIGGSALVATA
ncbi:10183_t:CDS:2, partial [Gigaspora rosea]